LEMPSLYDVRDVHELMHHTRHNDRKSSADQLRGRGGDVDGVE
jgi:hypothetical protein